MGRSSLYREGLSRVKTLQLSILFGGVHSTEALKTLKAMLNQLQVSKQALSQNPDLSATAGPSEFLEVLEQAISSLERERKDGAIAGGTVNGGLVEIGDYDRIVILGDFHGDSKTLFRMLDEIDYETYFSSARNKMVFLGDYADRGNDSIGVLHAVCELKRAHPNSVILMRGNHEAPSELPFSPYDLPDAIDDRFGESAKAIYGRLLALFRNLTLVTILQGRVLMVHGGLPTELFDDWKQAIVTAQENLRSRVMEEILWNDPRPLEGAKEWLPSARGVGRYFGRAVTERWLSATGTKVVIRGHEPCNGFRIDHCGKILTLFSSNQPYPRFGASYLIASKTELDSISEANALTRYIQKL